MSQQIPQPLSKLAIADLAQRLTPTDYSLEGNGIITNATVPKNATTNIFNQTNPFRKTITLINDGTVDLSLIMKDQNNVEREIPILKNGGSISFNQVIRGHYESCLNGISMVQYITNCEYMGLCYLKNASATTDGSIKIYEGL